MQWYKHSTGSHDDPDISDAWDKLGDFGYVGFFVILEIYGQEFSHRDSENYISISQAFLRRKLRKSWTNVGLLLNFYSKRKRILSKIDGDNIMLMIPKFIEVASNWTKRIPTEIPTEVPTAKEVEEEIEEIKKKDIPHTSHTCSLMPVNRFHTQEYQEYKKNALDILHHLNTLYGKHFPDHYMGISVIIDRLYEGKHQEDFTRIMNTKLRDPHFQKNRNLYCPETLFSEKNFERYLHEDPDGWRLTPKPPEPEIEFTHSSDDWYKGLKKENDETAPA